MSETLTAAQNALAWFEIPVNDLDRARRFYEALLETAFLVRMREREVRPS